MSPALATVQTLLQERFGVSPEQVGPDQLLEPLGIDSLGAVELMFELEERFGISLSEQRAQATTVGEVAAIVERALTAKARAA